ncbi:MAG: helix-turn-helix transcriptional regulator [Clostridia bacterium]|nr:helix-turn-helix transcriptional regulator [Clostridia bacterium]
MKLNIGTNIKRLRLSKGLTQEQLAERLNVSAAAVSKWESESTYPDITMLFPLAEIFDISIDELLGHDEAKANTDVDRILGEYMQLHTIEGRFSEARKIIVDARKKYPHNYQILRFYMWDIIDGQRAGTDPKLLLENKGELKEICDCILDGCKVDSIRADAINVKAKLLYATGDTDEAIKLLSTLPTYQAPFVIEELFPKDTPEFLHWSKINYYGLIHFTSLKLTNLIRYDPAISDLEKAKRMESAAEAFYKMSQGEGLEGFCIGAEIIYNLWACMLIAKDAPVEEIIRVQEKDFAMLKKITELAKSEDDNELRMMITRTYKETDLVSFQVNRLIKFAGTKYEKLRGDPKYLEMLNRWVKK